MASIGKNRHEIPGHGLPEDELPIEAQTAFVRPTRLGETARLVLLNNIRRRRWSSELPSERHLASDLRISRPTLRLALHSLAEEGVIKLQPRRPSTICRSAIGARHRLWRAHDIVLLYNGRSKPDLTSIAPLVVMLQQKCHRFGFGLRLVDAMQSGVKGVAASLDRIDSEYRPSFYVLASVPGSVHGWFSRRDLPCVIMGSRVPGIRLPAIDVDQGAMVTHAVGYLVRHRHRSLGFLQLPVSSVGSMCGVESFHHSCAGFKAHKVRGIVQISTAHPDAIARAVRRMFTCANPPTAVIFPDLEFGIGLYTTLADLRLQIPHQVSALSLGYWPLQDYLQPKPTCYWVSWDKVARYILDFVEHYARFGVWPGNSHRVLPEFRAGESVAKLL